VKLSTDPTYPQAWTYVLKLHREAAPAEGRIIGRLEHLASGRRLHFTSAAELIACLDAGTAQRPAGTGNLEPTQE